MGLFPAETTRDGEERSRPSFVRRNWRRAKFVAGGPIANVGFQQISEGQQFIRGLWEHLRRGAHSDARLKTGADGSIDMLETAFSFGISVEALVEQFRLRQAQTARASYATFSLGSVSLALWLYNAVQIRLSSARLFSALEFLPLCTLFFLLALKSAWMNWQIRTRRLGSAINYLTTSEPFLPR